MIGIFRIDLYETHADIALCCLDVPRSSIWEVREQICSIRRRTSATIEELLEVVKRFRHSFQKSFRAFKAGLEVKTGGIGERDASACNGEGAGSRCSAVVCLLESHQRASGKI